MAEVADNVLFQRGKMDDNEDIWDDTALIEAYDEAVSLIKIKIAEQKGWSVTDEDLKAASKSNRNSKKRAKSKKTRKWKVGDRCRARFTEDQCLYEADVVSIDESEGTCYVRYVDYGNEEEQSIKDLLRAHRRKHKHVQESENETDSGMDWRSGHSSQHASRPTSHPFMAPPTWPGLSEQQRPSLGALFPGMMGMPPPPPPGPYSTTPRLPFMPPPPPPPVLGDMSEEDNEALCSMLMAWYMSGYHTGYYQGLQQSKKETGIGSSFVNR